MALAVTRPLFTLLVRRVVVPLPVFLVVLVDVLQVVAERKEFLSQAVRGVGLPFGSIGLAVIVCGIVLAHFITSFRLIGKELVAGATNFIFHDISAIVNSSVGYAET